MKPKPFTALTVISAAVLAFSGCAQNSTAEDAPPAPEQQEDEAITLATPSEPPQPNVELLSHGRYTIDDPYGAQIEFDLPTAADHPSVADIESLRQQADAPEVEYVVVEVDNRNGTEDVMMGGFSVFDIDGNEYEFQGAEHAISDWVTDDENYYLSDELMYESRDVEDELEFYIPYAAQGELILIHQGDDLPDEFTRIATYPYPAELADAYPVD